MFGDHKEIDNSGDYEAMVIIRGGDNVMTKNWNKPIYVEDLKKIKLLSVKITDDKESYYVNLAYDTIICDGIKFVWAFTCRNICGFYNSNEYGNDHINAVCHVNKLEKIGKGEWQVKINNVLYGTVLEKLVFL